MRLFNQSQLLEFCIDFQNLNLVSTGMGWPIPNIFQMFQRIGSNKPSLCRKLDYFYIRVPSSASRKGFSSIDGVHYFMGVYEWNRVHMGL